MNQIYHITQDVGSCIDPVYSITETEDGNHVLKKVPLLIFAQKYGAL